MHHLLTRAEAMKASLCAMPSTDVQAALDTLLDDIEAKHVAVVTERSTMPRWSYVASLHCDLSGITRPALVVAEAYLSGLLEATRTSTGTRHTHTARQVELDKLGMASDFGPAGRPFTRHAKGQHPWSLAWARAKALNAMEWDAYNTSKGGAFACTTAIRTIDTLEAREYAEGYATPVDDGAYLFPEITPALSDADLASMAKHTARRKATTPKGVVVRRRKPQQ